MGFSSRLIKRAIRELIEEAPMRTPLEEEHLAHPRTEEARLVLAFVPTLQQLPVDDGIKDVLPVAAMALQGVALDCEALGELAEQRRAQVRAWVQALRAALPLPPNRCPCGLPWPHRDSVCAPSEPSE